MAHKIILGIIIIVALVAGIVVYKQETNKTISSSIQNSSNLSSLSTLTGVTWSTPTQTSEQTVYGNLTGEKITSEMTGDTQAAMNFENKHTLVSEGFSLDINQAADGPGSSQWGYKRTINGQEQIITFSYTTEPSSNIPNEPLQFNCPCKINLSIFQSSPFNNPN